MKKLFVSLLLAVMLSAGCGVNHEDFVKDSGDIYVQMFTDGEQTTKVSVMYDDYQEKYESYKDDDLYKAIEGMYNGLSNGTATEHQLKAMRLLNE